MHGLLAPLCFYLFLLHFIRLLWLLLILILHHLLHHHHHLLLLLHHHHLLLLTRDTTRRLCNFFVSSPFFTSNPSPIPIPLLPSLSHYPPISYFRRVRPHLGTSVQPTEFPIVTSISHALTNKDGLAYRYFKLQYLTLDATYLYRLPAYLLYTFHLLL